MKKVMFMFISLLTVLGVCSCNDNEVIEPVAVSYTHLDVYKRQACNGIKYGFSGFCGSFFGFVDVYVGFHAV